MNNRPKPTAEGIKTQKQTLQERLKAKTIEFAKKYGNLANFRKYLADKFNLNTQESQNKIMAVKAVKDAFTSFRSAARIAIVGFAKRLKHIRPKIRTSVRNLVRMRTKLEKIRVAMRKRFDALKKKTQSLDRKVKGEKYRIESKQWWSQKKSVKIPVEVAKYKPFKYTIDLSKRKGLQKLVEGWLKAPADKVMSTKDFRKKINKKIEEYKKYGELRITLMHALDKAVHKVVKPDFKTTKTDMHAYWNRVLNRLRGSHFYKSTMELLKGNNTELGDLTIATTIGADIPNVNKYFNQELQAAFEKQKKQEKIDEQIFRVDAAFLSLVNRARRTIPGWPKNKWYKDGVWMKYIKMNTQYKSLAKDIQGRKSPKGFIDKNGGINADNIDTYVKKHYFPLVKYIMEQNLRPPKISSCTYKDGVINVTGKDVRKMRLESFRYQPKISISQSSFVSKVEGMNIDVFNPIQVVKQHLERGFYGALSNHINKSQFVKKNSRILTNQILGNINLVAIAKDIVGSHFSMRILGKASADGDYEYNKELAKKRAKKAKRDFIRKNKLPKSFANQIVIRSVVEGPDGNPLKPGDEKKLYTTLANMWKKRPGAKEFTSKQMATYLRYFNRNLKKKLPKGMFEFLDSTIGNKRGVEYAVNMGTGISIGFTTKETSGGVA